AAGERHADGRDHGQVHRPVAEDRLRVRVTVHQRGLGETHYDHGRRTDDRAGTQVDTAHDDDLGDTERDDPDDCDLQDHNVEPLLVEQQVELVVHVEKEAAAV